MSSYYYTHYITSPPSYQPIPHTPDRGTRALNSPSPSSPGTTKSTPERKQFVASILSFLATPPSPERKSPGPSYLNPKGKTTFCHLHLWNRCRREICDFAHDESELKAVPVPNNYKTAFCRQESAFGTCNYNFNCNYIHRQDWIERYADIVVVRTPHPFFPSLLVIYKIGKISSV